MASDDLLRDLSPSIRPSNTCNKQQLSCCDAEVVLGYKHGVVMQVVVVGPEVRRQYNC